MVCPEQAWGRQSAGVEERGMQARVAQEPGRPCFLHPYLGGTGAAAEIVQAPRGAPPRGAKRGMGWYRRAKATKRGGTGGEGSESTDSTVEGGEPAPGDPLEGSGGPDDGAF
jgi:hypothetical protein